MKRKPDRPTCSQADTGSRKLFNADTERKRGAEPLAVVPLILRKRPRWVDRDM
jgi:hypothetical protein